ncbi:hypothetical protein FM119_02405 [Mycetocola reblochoni REB411]|uniref:Integral membrane protein n=2 Tax=Mycetocola reblochoni TaxID=331618 RepID=A0A1R4ILX5_9MICO|nr:hypothetical protein FM119_02405 [Mycetocola reblochoni REB411]
MIAVVGCYTAADAALRGYPLLAGTVLAWCAVVAWFIAGVLLRPRLHASDSGVVVQNPWVTHELPWAALRSAEPGLQLTLIAEDGAQIRVWSVPSSGIALRTHSIREAAAHDGRVVTDATRGPAVADALESMRDRFLAAGDAPSGPRRRSVDTPSLVVGGALLALAVGLTLSAAL